MSKQRVSSCASAALLGLALVVSLGSASDASAVAVMVSSRPVVVAQGDAERQAVADWLHRLTDAARRMQGQQAAVGFDPAGVPGLVRVRFPSTPSAQQRVPVHLPRPGCRLIDLPPPTA